MTEKKYKLEDGRRWKHAVLKDCATVLGRHKVHLDRAGFVVEEELPGEAMRLMEKMPAFHLVDKPETPQIQLWAPKRISFVTTEEIIQHIKAMDKGERKEFEAFYAQLCDLEKAAAVSIQNRPVQSFDSLMGRIGAKPVETSEEVVEAKAPEAAPEEPPPSEAITEALEKAAAAEPKMMGAEEFAAFAEEDFGEARKYAKQFGVTARGAAELAEKYTNMLASRGE